MITKGAWSLDDRFLEPQLGRGACDRLLLRIASKQGPSSLQDAPGTNAGPRIVRDLRRTCRDDPSRLCIKYYNVYRC